MMPFQLIDFVVDTVDLRTSYTMAVHKALLQQARNSLKLQTIIVKPIINWALSNSLNAYNRHSDWHKLEVYATKMSTYF